MLIRIELNYFYGYRRYDSIIIRSKGFTFGFRLRQSSCRFDYDSLGCSDKFRSDGTVSARNCESSLYRRRQLSSVDENIGGISTSDGQH